jgi:hypothetical protein
MRSSGLQVEVCRIDISESTSCSICCTCMHGGKLDVYTIAARQQKSHVEAMVAPSCRHSQHWRVKGSMLQHQPNHQSLDTGGSATAGTGLQHACSIDCSHDVCCGTRHKGGTCLVSVKRIRSRVPMQCMVPHCRLHQSDKHVPQTLGVRARGFVCFVHKDLQR